VADSAKPVTEPLPTAAMAMAKAPAEPLIEADELVEDVSIDGMCGVY
jgi:mycofactocin precursor